VRGQEARTNRGELMRRQLRRGGVLAVEQRGDGLLLLIESGERGLTSGAAVNVAGDLVGLDQRRIGISPALQTKPVGARYDGGA
jgi:hypothetical protein